ncbi:MAG: folC [Ilumatobacteraceae bacterium]|nr:folC [Ilumatobacteraceae bacterium]
MNIDAAVAWLEGHIDYGTWAARSARTGDVELSLDRMHRFATVLGNPQSSLAIIHVTGTNGKGSTSRMITRLLMAESLRVGTYSSPHLSRYNERFRIGDVDVDDAALADLLTRMAAAEEALGEPLMPFEVLTGAAYTLFAERDLDVAVVEVGVLGRFDATNVADGRVAVVTNIGFDHTNGDGDWQLRIATEKAGIVKPGAHLVLGDVDPRFDDAFAAQQPGAMWRLGHEIDLIADNPAPGGRRLTVRTPWQQLDSLDLPLHGAHQAHNCALAITAASAFLGKALHDDAARAGLAAVTMPARLEAIDTGADGCTVILDGAHNPDAAAALAAALAEIPCAGKRTLVVGLLAGRDPAAMMTAVGASTFDAVVCCTPPTARARPAAELSAAAHALGVTATAIDDIGDALTSVITAAGPDDQIVVTGSIYLVADARTWLLSRAG